METIRCAKCINSGFPTADKAYLSIIDTLIEVQKAVDNKQGAKFAISSLMKLASIALELNKLEEYEPFLNKLTFQQHKTYMLLTDEFKVTIKGYLIRAHNSSWDQLSTDLLNFGNSWLKSFQKTLEL